MNYEGVYLTAGYPDPSKVAEYALKVAMRNNLNLSEVKICDFGCGTGLVGKYLYEDGFREIDGIDASQGMIDEALDKGIYKNI